MRIVFTCGGTGGHINPAIAVANLFKERNKSTEILFIGAQDAMETKLVPKEGYKIETIPVNKLRHSMKPANIGYNLAAIVKAAGALGKAGKILRKFKPDVVVGMGGYASFPAVYAAARMKSAAIPTLIHESNAIPGITTKLLAKRVTRVMTGLPGVEGGYPKPEKVVLTGTPVREEFLFTEKEDAKRKLKLDKRPVVLSFFGSLGARNMNKAIAEMLKEETGEFQHIHACGSFGWEWMPGMLKDMGIKDSDYIRLQEYIYDMPTVMAASDLVICRGGASTLSELSAAGKPAIIIPSPNVTANHQEKNARKLSETGGVEVRLEEEIDGKKLYQLSTELLRNEKKLDIMSKSLKKHAIPDAGERIYRLILELAGQR